MKDTELHNVINNFEFGVCFELMVPVLCFFPFEIKRPYHILDFTGAQRGDILDLRDTKYLKCISF